MSTKRKAYNLLLPIVVYAAAGLTVLLLVGIIGYVPSAWARPFI